MVIPLSSPSNGLGSGKGISLAGARTKGDASLSGSSSTFINFTHIISSTAIFGGERERVRERKRDKRRDERGEEKGEWGERGERMRQQ